jgi:hypothetical protein
MKKLILGAALVLSTFAVKVADAQIKFNLNLNIGSQPDWGPTGYDHVEYYYMPDIDAYYYVPGHQYVYQQNNAWVRTTTLPTKYRNFDVYNSYKVVVNQQEPWRNQAAIRAKYAQYKGRRGQTAIRDSRDKKYQNHWKGDNHGRPGNDRGRDDHGRDDHGRGNGHH